MAQREVERLVDRIRLQRLRAGRSCQQNRLLAGVRRQLRRHPVAWMVGGATVGFVVLPFLLPLALRAPRRLARMWLRGSLQGGALHLATVALAAGQAPRPRAAAAEASGWSHDDEEARSGPGEEPPLQASGGPVHPLRAF